MSILNKMGKKNFCFFVIGLILLVLLILWVIIFKPYKSDGMQQTKGVKVLYRTHSKNGWTSWTNNGMTSGDKKTPIDMIQIKLVTKDKSNIFFNCYYDKKWSGMNYNNTICDSNKKGITGIKMNISGKVYNNNSIFYRIHNKNGWYKWSDENEQNGTSNDKRIIDAIEIKVVPRSAYYADFLKDYDKGSLIESNEF